jgi:hypothetical protein
LASSAPAGEELDGSFNGGWFGDLRLIPAGRAVRVAADLHFGETGRLRVEGKETPDERIAITRYQFQGLVRLKRPDDAWEHAQDPSLASGRG